MENASDALTYIPVDKPFIASCAEHLLAAHGKESLGQGLILVSNQRTGRLLREALTTRCAPEACLLPEIIAMGHYTKPTLLKWLGHHAPAREALLAVREAMSRATHISLLTAQIRAAGDALASYAHVPRALALAESLFELQQECIMHQVNHAALRRYAHDDVFYDYKAAMRHLFSIIQENWPTLCAAIGRISEAEHQQQLQQILLQYLPFLPTQHYVAVVGSTGSVLSTRELMQAVAKHPKGRIIIPGAGSVAVMTDANYHVNKTLTALNVAAPQTPPTAAVTAEYIALENTEQEARALALLVQKTLMHSNDQCLVISPDMALIKRAYHYLTLRGVLAQSLPLEHLANQPAMRGVRACLHYMMQPDDAYAQRLLLEVSGPTDTELHAHWERLVHHLDKTHLRKPYLRQVSHPDNASDETVYFIERWPRFLEKLAQQSGAMLTPSGWLERLEQAYGYEPWLNPPALPETAAEAFNAYDNLGRVSISEMVQLLDYIGQTPVASHTPQHPRVHFLTPVEARLQPAEHVIFAGFHDANWPSISPQNTWLSDRLREELGLPCATDDMAHACHDAWMHAHSAARITITTSHKVAGSLTNPSPLLALFEVNDQSSTMTGYIEALSRPESYRPLTPTLPNPPVSARPRKLNVSALDSLFINPYSLYAQSLLQLSVLDGYGTKAHVREFGTCAHKIMQLILSEDVAAADIEVFSEGLLAPYRLSDIEKKFWMARFHVIAHYAEELRSTLTLSRATFTSEKKLSAVIELGENQNIEFEGRLDLLTHHKSGTIEITDFKTGSALSATDMDKGRSAQHLGYAMLLQTQNIAATCWTCTQLPKVNTPENSTHFETDIAGLHDRKQALCAELHAMCFEETPFPSHPFFEEGEHSKFTDYDGISRIEEWG